MSLDLLLLILFAIFEALATAGFNFHPRFQSLPVGLFFFALSLIF